MDELVQRAFLSRIRDFTHGAHFPASKSEITADAVRRNTPSDILEVLLQLPIREYRDGEDLVAEVDRRLFGTDVATSDPSPGPSRH
jgi:hypothetical protein